LNANKILPYVPPSQIAKRIEHRLAVSSALMAFGSGMRAFSQSTVTTHTTGHLSAYDSYGDWGTGSFYATSTARIPVDRTQQQAEDRAEHQALRVRGEQKLAELNRDAIGAQTVMPTNYIVGTTMFSKPRTANLKALTGKDFKSYFVRVLVPIGAENFVFLFPVELLQALPHPKQ
jgi:hypothetical protein